MQAVINDLNTLTNGLYFISESDAQWTTHELSQSPEDGSVMEQLVEIAQKEPSCEVEVRAWDTFLQNATTAQDWMSDDEKNTVARYQKLKEYVSANLSDIEVYRIGTIELDIFIVGKTAEGTYIALGTKAVET